MLSRGALRLASSRTRRGIALSWSVLFILSLLLQYATFALAPAALAVHDEQFQLDGNAVDDAGSAQPDDWATLVAGGGSADAFTGIIHEAPDSTIFTTGGSKDDLNTTSWRWTDGSVPDKDDLLDGFAALYNKILYFGADRFANNGDSAIGFWFFQNGLNVNGNGTFSPAHKVGDLFVVSHFENGGAVSEIQLFSWVGSGGSDGALDLVATGQICTGSPANDEACGIANQTATPAPWSYTPKAGAAGTFPQFSFFEGGLDLSQVFTGTVPCFGSFLVETRSSQEINAQLKDFIAGDFNTCKPPTIATAASDSTVQLGGTVTDTATLSGNDGPVSGSVKFFVCGPNPSATACTSGGTQVGGAVTVNTANNPDSATSAAFTPPAAGFYCFRAEYTPDADSQYLAGSHTNATTECFKVLEAHIAITKTANPQGPVNAGDSIGFDITVTNEGDGTALGVHVTDVLPAGINWSAGAPTGDITGVSCAIAAGTLTCDDASMAAGDSFTVHISGTTDANDCGTVTNTASVSTTNDGSDEASASVDVLCAQIAITKTANPAGPVSAGDTVGFDITVTNDGAGTATNVHVTDVLPAGINWSAGAPTGDITGVSCAIAAGTLTCDDASMASGDSFTVHISGATGPEDCGTITNTASVTTANDGSDEATASVDVLCPDVQVVKTAPNEQIPAGQDLVFTITTTNIGDGVARNVTLTDTLPAGFDWSENSAACEIAAGVLSCDFGDLDPGESASVTLTAPTSALGENPNIDCSEGGITVDNTATATSTNEGQDVLGNNTDDASIDVLCSALLIQKSFTGNTNGTDPDLGVPSAKIGDTLHYTLEYAGAGLLENAVITDVLPQGLDFVAGTALGDANFNDGTYDSATRTITWHAKGTLPDPASGAVTYDVKVLATAPDFAQPLVNVATIDSDQTNPDSDTASVAVLAPPEELTPPPTSTITPQTAPSNPGFALMLILLGVAGLTLGIGFVTPAPARVRRRDRLG